MNVDNFLGDLTNISAEKEALAMIRNEVTSAVHSASIFKIK